MRIHDATFRPFCFGSLTMSGQLWASESDEAGIVVWKHPGWLGNTENRLHQIKGL